MQDLKVSIIGSTQLGHEMPKEDALMLGSHQAGICYMADSFSQITLEKSETTKKRVERTLGSGHHSVYGHAHFNLLIEDIPKILAMIMNNEKVYVTSEKSARYTEMQPSAIEQKLYDEWKVIFNRKIEEVYPHINHKTREKLALENARYLISVFTPTTMGHTLSFRQLNYMMHWFNDFIDNAEGGSFNDKIKVAMDQFNSQLSHLYVPELDPEMKARGLSLLAGRDREQHFGDVYLTSYMGSFAQLAQAHRHRTINYEMMLLGGFSHDFFVPPIIEEDDKLWDKWADDTMELEDRFPQAMQVWINESGRVEDFISKCYERLCGRAQLEIAMQTKETLDSYVELTKNKNYFVHEMLLPLSEGPKCTFPEYECVEPCSWGKKGLERLI